MSGAKIIPFPMRPGLRFGVYLGGPSEVHHEMATGKPDIPDEINRVLDLLQGDKHFLVRTYLGFTGTDEDAELVDMPSMPDLARYTWRGRKLDLVLSNWDRRGDMAALDRIHRERHLPLRSLYWLSPNLRRAEPVRVPRRRPFRSCRRKRHHWRKSRSQYP